MLRSKSVLILCLAIGVGTAGAAVSQSKQTVTSGPVTFTTLHAFKGTDDGEDPIGGLVADVDGNLYGTAYYDGACVYCGTVFMLRRPASASDPWQFSVIYAFPSSSGLPRGALAIRGGVLYGTTPTEVYRLRPLDKTKTRWRHTTIHALNPVKQQTPEAGVVFGPDGALYGSTAKGGRHNSGIVFRLTGSGDQEWSYEVLHEFESAKSNGPGGSEGPHAEFLIDPATGVIYGTTYSGGRHGQGTVFQLAPNHGVWEHTVLHDFRGVYGAGRPDGSQPRGQLVFGPDGALYGTTELGDKGGSWNQGTIYRLENAGGQWNYTVLHEFIGGDKDGSEPKSGLRAGSSERPREAAQLHMRVWSTSSSTRAEGGNSTSFIL
jgi:uncharacterized repeat protein (TIGR03803 family)